MKEMVYGKISKRVELIDYDYYKHYRYAILNMHGSHPCCYVMIPFDHVLAEQLLEDYESVGIECHGGLTYCEGYLRLTGRINEIGNFWEDEIKDISGIWIGWDYAHCNDYTYDPYINREPMEWEHKWTYDELLTDVKAVIDQIVEGDHEHETGEL